MEISYHRFALRKLQGPQSRRYVAAKKKIVSAGNRTPIALPHAIPYRAYRGSTF
jgi:hypothetical protein